MLLLLDHDRTPVAEIMDYLSVTISIRFSQPSLIDMQISETSDISGVIEELMYVYHVETKTLFLIDYIQRDTILTDSKAVIVKGNSMEGFLEQRVVFKDKLLEDADLQISIKSLIDQSIINPTDITRKVDFFRFENSTDPIVLAQHVKGLVSGVSVMSAVTSLLESKNLGYKATYDLNTKLLTFKILAGRNLCDGFTSVIHGAHLPQVVTLSSRSETLKDVKSIVDLAPYKTRVYIQNFDNLKIFNRGTTKTGINLREGYLSTGYGDGLLLPELPLPRLPEFPELPPEIPIPENLPESNLLGLYILTNKDRLLACAFYPGLQVPELWLDVTPDPVDGVPVSMSSAYSARVTMGTGDLVYVSKDRKKLYRASMVGGWFGVRYFLKAEPFFDVATVYFSYPTVQFPRIESVDNIIGALGVDMYTGRVAGTVVNPWMTSPDYGTFAYGPYHFARLFDGTAYDVAVPTIPLYLNMSYPGNVRRLELNNDRVTLSGINSTGGTRVEEFTGSQWDFILNVPGAFNAGLHFRPEYGNNITYFVSELDWYVTQIHRSKDLFGEGPIETFEVSPTGFNMREGAFSVDGKSMAVMGSNRAMHVVTFAPDDLTVSTVVTTPNTGNCLGLSSAGTELGTGKQQWGYLISGRAPDTENLEINLRSPAYYVSSNSDFSGVINMTPLLKTYLSLGPYGLLGDGLLAEWPIAAWPILG
jgi:hypothetical protein